MTINIRISFPNGSETLFDYDPRFESPGDHTLSLMEQLFPEVAAAGKINSDTGSRSWFTEDGERGAWFEED